MSEVDTAARTLNIDISDIYRARGRTGIQRVVREIGSRLLSAHDAAFAVRIIRFDAAADHYFVVDPASALDFLRGNAEDVVTTASFDFAEFGAGDVFFDIDAVWSSPLKRPSLYSRLKARDVTIVTMVYDLVPLLMPQHVHPETVVNWTEFIGAVYTHSDIVLLDSRSAETDFIRFHAGRGEVRHIPTVVVGLGADFAVVGEPSAEEDAAASRFIDGEYLLFVSTIEPRKLHRTALEAMDRIHAARPNAHLVIAGRHGWNSDDTVALLTGHPLYGRRVHWMNTPSDAMLDRLYDRATATLYLSSGEGYGLPVAESLARGRVSIASGNSSIFEVGENFTDYVTYGTPGEIAETALAYLSNPRLRELREQQISDGFVPRTWDAVVSTISQVFAGLGRAAAIAAVPLPETVQWVFISNVPESLERTIALLETHVDWVSEVVIIAPANLESRIGAIPTRTPLTFIAEESVLGERMVEFRQTDHVRKNWMLRSSLPDLAEIAEEFIMLDDDNQPGRSIGREVFFGDQSRYLAYYFYELGLWPHHITAFDAGQHETHDFLRARGLELLAYASHQPQVINKTLFREAVALVAADNSGVEEWALYFNYLSSRYPTLIDKRVYRTLGWPGEIGGWRTPFPSIDYLFENYYPEAYERGDMAGITPDSSFESKVDRRIALEAPYRRSDELFTEGQRIASRLDLAHGAMTFERDGDFLVVTGVPHIIVVGESAPARVRLRYARIANVETQFCYRVTGGDLSFGLVVGVPPEFAGSPDNGIVEIDFPGHPLAAGTHDLEFFAIIGGETVFTPGVILRSRLVVVADDSTMLQALETL